MRIRDEFPRKVRVIENTFITLADGCRLAAKIWLPEDAEADPVPAILEYLPYRKRDGTVERDELTHPYFAGHGYAGVRVDLRGAGESDGVMPDEYLAREQADALEVIDWLARQPWCSGAVGMIGISWGGFNGLQVAALRPPALRAIITLCSTDDRYADDIHFMGGCLLNDNLSWASTMFCHNSHPPDPLLVGERWRELWLERLEGSGLWVENWLRHQRRDAFWQQGSVCQDYGAIACPVYAVGGWADAYSNAVFRLLQNLEVPRKGLVGPWAHKYPHFARPGPAVGFLQEALRWWDHWLKDIDNGIMDEPMLRVWMQESVPPAADYETRPGRWVAEDAWPSTHIAAQRYALNPGRIERPAGAEQVLTICSPQTVGWTAGQWCPHGLHADQAVDQRPDDGGSLVFETEPLGERLEIFGAPLVDLELSADRPLALVAARLSGVAPDGAATRVTYGLLNLTHRDSHEQPTPLEPGRRYSVRIQLGEVAQAFPAGHRIRLSLSTAYWPIAWPSPAPVTLSVHAGVSSLSLPLRAARAADDDLAAFPEPEGASPWRRTVIEAGRHAWTVTQDQATQETTVEMVDDSGRLRLDDIDLELRHAAVEHFSVRPQEPLSARGETAWTLQLARGDWRVETRTRTVMTATADSFDLRATLEAFEDQEQVFSKSWEVSVPRDLV